jgi:hypothetical protein
LLENVCVWQAALVGKVFDEIDAKLERWLLEQPMFFVGTAPAGAHGHVNVSPKGYPGTFRVLGPHRVAYLDTVGSGAETIAHVHENRRLVLMFCAFAGAPRIVRLHGTGQVHQLGDEPFDALLPTFDVTAIEDAGLADVLRSVIEVDVTRIADSCGYGVPLMQFEGWRPQMRLWADNRLRQEGPDALTAYMRTMNAESIDGLPGIQPELLPERS